MDDATDHSPIIDTRLAARVCREIRRNPKKLRLAQPEVISIHHGFLLETLNHKPTAMPINLWVWTLERC